MLLNEAYVGVWTFKKRHWQKVRGLEDDGIGEERHDRKCSNALRARAGRALSTSSCAGAQRGRYTAIGSGFERRLVA
jgi:hypothetical protein